MLLIIFHVEENFQCNPKPSLEGLLWVRFGICGHLERCLFHTFIDLFPFPGILKVMWSQTSFFCILNGL